MSLKKILLIEDERINAMAFQKGLSRVSVSTELVLRETAEKAFEYLESTEDLPDIIILDLNLPRMNGVEFLKLVKLHEKFKKIPVIILTTSVNPKDKTDCFELQAAGYFIKPLDYFDLIRSVFEYWTNSEFVEM
ncbi:MAG: response regulator [Bacteroidia bacterium]